MKPVRQLRCEVPAFIYSPRVLPWIVLGVLLTGGSGLHAQNWLWGVNSISNQGNNGLQAHGVGHTPDQIPGGGMYNTGEYWDPVQTSFGNGFILPTSAGLNDAYVCKFDATGSFLWANAMQGPAREAGMKVVADRYDNCYVVGIFASSQLTLNSVNGLTTTINNTGGSSGTSDIFVAKYSPAGVLLWAQAFGGVKDDRGIDIAMGFQTQSTVLITGGFYSPLASFGGTVLTNVNASGQKEDAFVAVLDVSGGAVLNAWAYGGNGNDFGMSLLSDGTAHIHLTGSFASPLMPMGMTNLSSNGGSDMFLTDIDFLTGTPNWAVSAGSVNDDAGVSLAATGPYLYVAGIYRNTINFGGPTLAPAGGADAFLAQYDLTGAAQWARPIAGPDTEHALCVAAWCDNIYVGGRMASASINLGSTTITNFPGFPTAFLIKYDDTGTDLWSVTPTIQTDNAVIEDLVAFPGVNASLNDFHVGLCGNYIDAVDFGPYFFTSGSGVEGFVIEFDDSYPFNVSPSSGTYCITDLPFNFSAVPAGGTWSGPGITDPVLGTFDPAVAGIGMHSILYSLPLGSSCVLSSSVQITVLGVDWPKHPLPTLSAQAYGTEVIGSHLGGDGQYFMTGFFVGPGSIDFGGNTTPLSANDPDIFVTMYDDCGAQWSFGTGSSGWHDWGVALKYSQFDGKLYLGGNLGGDLPQFQGTSGGVANSTHPALALNSLTPGKVTGFLAQLELDGTVNWISVIDPQSANSTIVNDIAIDQATGMIYVVGAFDNTVSFAPPGGTHTAPGNTGAFLAKYDNSGFVQWSAAHGIGNNSRGNGVGVYNNNGDVLITGYVGKLPGFAGNTDYFVRRYTAAGAVVTTIHISTDYNSYGSDIVVDQNNSNQFFVTGAYTDKLDLSTSLSPLPTLGSNGSYDIFTAAYGFNSQVQWANTAGGVKFDGGEAIALVDDDVWLCGVVEDVVTLPVAPFTHSTLNGTRDIFVARHKIGSGASGSYTIRDGSQFDHAVDIAVNDDGFAYVTGNFSGSLSLNSTLFANSLTDPFLARLEISGSQQNFFRDAVVLNPTADDLPAAFHVAISPNPAEDILLVHIEGTGPESEFELLILDIRGDVVLRSHVNGSRSQPLRIDLRDHAAGSYFLRVRDGRGQVTRSFVLR